MYGDQISDLLAELYKLRFENDPAKKMELSRKLFEETLPNFLKIFENIIIMNHSGFLVTSGLTWADLFLVNIFDFLGDKKAAILANFPRVKALDENVRAVPRIADWLAKRPKTEM